MDKFLSIFLKISAFILFLCLFSLSEMANAHEMSAILYDYDTGQILYEKNPDITHFPASLTKMMTLYLTFEALTNEHIGLNTQFPVSYNASIQEPSKLGLLPGQYVRVQDLMLGTATNSSNDAATVLAEGLGGNVDQFSKSMNQKAQQLGMQCSYFENPTGLPNPRQATTARDMLRLGVALYRDFPRYYYVFSTRYFNYHGHPYKNHNHLLFNYEGTDGIKTGYIQAEGYNLVGSVNRNGKHLMAVVLGGKTYQLRDHTMEWLFNHGFGDKQFDESTMPKPKGPAFFKKKPIKHRKHVVKALSRTKTKIHKEKHHKLKHFLHLHSHHKKP
jgi:D-alanyl-D-alanine carboxypeptidase